MIQVTYGQQVAEGDALVRSRLESVRELLTSIFESSEWDGPEPTIETNMVRTAAPEQGGE